MPSPHAVNGLVPLLLRRQLAAAGAGTPEYATHRFPAATLIADVSGFTSLAERLTSRGPEGVEELSRLVNRWFGAMVDVIDAHGGDLIRFAGDAPIAAFPALETGGLREAIARAFACAEALRTAMSALTTAEASVSVRIGIGAGQVTSVVAGGVNGQWEFVLGGAAVDQMSEAERRAAPGGIVLSPEAAAVLGDVARPAPTLAPLHVPPADERLARPFVPPAALQFIDAGQAAWTAELRQVTVLFLGIAGVELDSPGGPARLHDVLGRLQAAILRAGRQPQPVPGGRQGPDAAGLVGRLGTPARRRCGTRGAGGTGVPRRAGGVGSEPPRRALHRTGVPRLARQRAPPRVRSHRRGRQSRRAPDDGKR